MTTSSITAVTPGTPLSPSRGRSCQSGSAIGPTSVDQFEGWYKPARPSAVRSALLQRRAQRRERGAERRADTIDGSKDGDRNGASDQGIFDRGRGGLVRQEATEQ